MSQVSRRRLLQEIEKKIFSLFYESLKQCTSTEDATDFVNDLLSPTEKIMLSKRLAIAHLLIQKYSYESITELLHVSTTTVGMVSLVLKTKGAGLRKQLAILRSKKESNRLFQELGEAMVETLTTQYGRTPLSTRRWISNRKKDRQIPL